MTFTRRRSYITYAYTLENNNLQRVTNKKDLGVLFQENLKFDQHIDIITKSASRNLGLILRHSKFFFDYDTIVTLYTALVRSKLEYACVIWAPTSDFLIKKIEKVQADFSRVLFLKFNGFYPKYPCAISYNILREQMCIESLLARRNKFKLIFVHNIINNNLTCPELLEKINIKIPNLSLRNRRQIDRSNSDQEYFKIPRQIKIIYAQSPLMSALSLYNKYSLELDLDSNLNVFKNKCTILSE
uniref:RNA-directed DNA polymerase from mobile element jockey n=1 Tax=Cacopsylla melanoneura TaxID=428564 RepID=A0A8D8QYF0_9HEMI